MESSKNQIVTLVPLRGVDLADRTFAVAPKEFDLVSSSLLDSIRKRGVLVPVRLVAIGGGRLRIVSGFRRVAAALDCGWEEIPALIEEEPEDYLEIFISLVWENGASREFSMLEKGFVLSKLKAEFQVSEERLIEEFLPLMGLRANRHNLLTLLTLDGLPEGLKAAIAGGQLIAEVALKLNRWSKAEQALFTGVVERYQLGRNKQKQLWELLADLRTSERANLTQLWVEWGISAIEESPDIRHEQRFPLIRQRIWELRYPVRSEYRKRLETYRRALSLPSGVQLQVPEDLEGDKVTLVLTADSADRLRDSVRALSKAVENEALDQIFDLI